MELKETRGRKVKYDYDNMPLNVGLPVAVSATSILGSAHKYCKRNNKPYKFKVRTINKQVYLYRVL